MIGYPGDGCVGTWLRARPSQLPQQDLAKAVRFARLVKKHVLSPVPTQPAAINTPAEGCLIHSACIWGETKPAAEFNTKTTQPGLEDRSQESSKTAEKLTISV